MKASDENAANDKCRVQAYALKVEYLDHPCGIDERKPRFSWKLRSDRQGQAQSAYRVVITKIESLDVEPKKPLEIVWDSEKVPGDDQAVEYAGKPLKPNSDYSWALTVWDWADQDETKKATYSTGFSTGLFAMGDEANPWKGRWIGLDDPEPDAGEKFDLSDALWIWTVENASSKAPPGQASFRKTFDIPEGEIVKAEAAFTADNTYRLFINGMEVAAGNNFRIGKIADVRKNLILGEKNVIAVLATNSGDRPNAAGLIGRLRITYRDGREFQISTDPSWKAIDGVSDEFLDQNFDDADWKQAFQAAKHGDRPWLTVATNTERPSIPARYLVKTFTLKDDAEEYEKSGGIVRATAFIAGLGYYELYLNGRRIGDHRLDPVLTDYDKRVPYVTYRIPPKSFRCYEESSEEEEHGTAGVNTINVVLGNGRYFAPRIAEPTLTRTFGYPKLLFQLELLYRDGTVQRIVSNEDWLLTTQGPIRENNDYDGEVYDARLSEPLGWKATRSKESDFHKASAVESPSGKLAAQMMPPMRLQEEIKPVAFKQVQPGVWVYDFGQNMVGWCRLSVNGPAGTSIRLRHAENLYFEGPDKAMIDARNLRGALCRDIYILRGDEREIYEPRFTYHGFRYVELTGWPETGTPPTLETLTGCVINTDLPVVGRFETSNETINKIYRCAYWGLRGNYLSIPTDCPQRDERHGWQGDRAGESKGEMYVFDNVSLYRKWLDDISDSQREDGNVSSICPNYWPRYITHVTWPSSFTIIPDSIHDMYADRRPIERHYEAMKRWLIGHLGPHVRNGIIDKDNYGDWCVPPEDPALIHSLDPARKTSREVLATAYYIYNLDLLKKYAEMLGRSDDAKEYGQKASTMRRTFNKKFLDVETGRIDNGTQTACILPLYFKIVPDDAKEKVFRYLVDRIEDANEHVGTGLIGGQWINRVLSEYGRADIAYRMATNIDYPSFGYMIENGATTIWELWNGNTADPAMNSGNHVMLLGDLVQWFYEYLAGIKADPVDPGFRHIIMKPHLVPGLEFVRAEYDSVRGMVRSSWFLDAEGFRWNIEIPPGSTATIHLPDGKTETRESGRHTFSVPSHNIKKK